MTQKKIKLGDEVELEVYPEYHCDDCYEVMHNHIVHCPVCKSNYAGTDIYDEVHDEKELTCDICGTTFEKISESWFFDCMAKIVTMGSK